MGIRGGSIVCVCRLGAARRPEPRPLGVYPPKQAPTARSWTKVGASDLGFDTPEAKFPPPALPKSDVEWSQLPSESKGKGPRTKGHGSMAAKGREGPSKRAQRAKAKGPELTSQMHPTSSRMTSFATMSTKLGCEFDFTLAALI